MTSPRLERRIGQEAINGWRLTSIEGDRAVLKRSSFGSTLGHVLIAVLTVWWSFGLLNLVYAAYAYHTHSEYKVVDESEPVDTGEAIDILRRRYAAGELDEDQFEARLQRLETTESMPPSDIALETD